MKKYLFVLVALMSFMLVSCSQSKLELAVESANKECPYSIGYGMTMQSITLEGMNVVYTVNCDESIIDLDVLEENSGLAKQSIIETLQSTTGEEAEGIAELISLLKDTDKGLLYKCVGESSGKEVNIRVSHSELVQ